ncbi:hypothetical protein NKG05_24595 [Oerskovia sp. M15]
MCFSVEPGSTCRAASGAHRGHRGRFPGDVPDGARRLNNAPHDLQVVE